MKRTIKHPGGTEEVLEGTPEELARHELIKQPQITIMPQRQELPTPKWPPSFPDPNVKWLGEQTRCAFDGLPDGVYGLVCNCPRHGIHC